MRYLFIFDNTLDTERLDTKGISYGDTVYLFPLTSIQSMIDGIIDKIGHNGIGVITLNSAEYIDNHSLNMRERYIEFIASLANLRVKGSSLVEWFRIDERTSFWWLTEIAEKNILKSNAFNSLVRLNVIHEVINLHKIDRIFVGIGDRGLYHSLVDLKQVYRLKTSMSSGIRARIKEWNLIVFILRLINHFISIMRGAVTIRRRFKGLKRKESSDKKFLIVTPYPNFRRPDGDCGVFKNGYFPHIQEAIEDKGIDIIWIAQYLPGNRFSRDAAFNYAERFIANGCRLYFIDEFCSLGLQFRVLFRYLRIGLRFLLILKQIKRYHSHGGYNFFKVFRPLWYISFIGGHGYWNLLQYYRFDRILEAFKAEKVMYIFEMQGWEKSLISARNRGHKSILYASQQGTISGMSLNFSIHPSEGNIDGGLGIPIPDKIICNGEVARRRLSLSGWDEERLIPAEAVRYLHLRKYIGTKIDIKKNNKIVIALSLWKGEAMSTFCFSYSAFKDIPVGFWRLKSHPFLNMEEILKFYSIDKDTISDKIIEGSIEDSLRDVKIAIVGESSVSIEAIALGCHVISPIAPEWVNMSPLRGIESNLVHFVSSPKEMLRIIDDIYQSKYDLKACKSEADELVNGFFYLEGDDYPKRFAAALDI